MGLVQLLRDVPYPDLMARHLLDAVLEDFRESGHHYLMHLVAERDHARRRCAAGEIAALDAKIHEHTIHEQIPQRWRLDFLFSEAAYQTFGDPLLPCWATILIEICTLEQHWEGALLGYPPENPYLLPGFHSAEDVHDTAWLEEARGTWSADLRAAVLLDAVRLLAIVALPPEPEDEVLDDALDETEAEPETACSGPWIH